jgi:hypothetical protein
MVHFHEIQQGGHGIEDDLKAVHFNHTDLFQNGGRSNF